MKKKNEKTMIMLVVCGLFLIVLLTLLTGSFYTGFLAKNGMTNTREEEKKAHYVMLTENGDSTFWNSVYESALEEAERNDVILELSRENDAYTIKERMEMCLAARVDGIILEYRGEKELDEGIAKATDLGIPVVSVSNDAGKKGSVSFVGVNDYQLAEKYGEQIVKILEPDMKEIMVLTHDTKTDEREAQIYNQINSMVVNAEHAPKDIVLETEHIPSSKAFDAEEAIWNLFQDKETLPDILVCLNEVDTECAYQALINYNLVGKVKIVGYYYTDIILNAIAEGIISSALDINTEELGKYSVEALLEYEKEGYVNSFFNVGLSVIDRERAEEILKYEKGL